MLIAQISDTHILAKSSDEAVGVDRAENLQQCVAGINRQGVDVVVHTGDMVHHGAAEQYSHLREILDGLEAPLYVIPGNRDRHDALRAAFDDAAYLPKSGEFSSLCDRTPPGSPHRARFNHRGRAQRCVLRTAARLAGGNARPRT